MKGCLKQPSRAPSPTNDRQPRKTVVFDAEGLEQFFIADEWDRTPSEPARHLSYQDILELKAIQRSLPMAEQPADLIGGRPASHYLSNVPIGLLPLLPEADAAPQPTSTVASPTSFSPTSWRSVKTPAPSIPRPQASTWHPPHLSHLPAARPPLNRQKARFAFLPLLEPSPSQSQSPSSSPYSSPPPSERSSSPDLVPSDSEVSHDPPTPSLTNASLDSSPLSRASSCSPEPSFFQLPPSKHLDFKHSPKYPEDNILPSDRWINDPHHIQRPGFGASSAPIPIPLTSSTPKRKKNVIYVNDMEIELDDDDDDDSNKNDECDACDDDEDGGSTPPAHTTSKPSAPASPSPCPGRSNAPPFPLSSYPSLSHSPPPSCHLPVTFKRNSPPASPTPMQGYTFRQDSSLTCGSARNSQEANAPGHKSSGGCSSSVLVPSA